MLGTLATTRLRGAIHTSNILGAGFGLLLAGGAFIIQPRRIIDERFFKRREPKRVEKFERLSTRIGSVLCLVGVVLILVGGVRY